MSGGRPRRSYAETDSSLEDLNPDNEPEYRPYNPAASTYKHVSAQELLAQRQAQLRAQAPPPVASGPVRRAPAAPAVNEDEEVEIDFEDSSVDVRASNNTLIRKAQQMQEDAEVKEREERAAAATAERARKDTEAKEKERARKAAADAEAAAAAASTAKREQEARQRALEEEEDERERAEQERQREELRKAAEIEDDDYGTDEFADDAEEEKKSSAAAKPTGLDALLTSDADEEAEIERARKLLEEQEEAELEAERRAAESQLRLSSTGSGPQLGTQAFLNPRFVAAGATGGGERSLAELDLNDSADLDVARQRQEAIEEAEAAEQLRKQQQQQQQAQADRRASLEAAVEDSYEEPDEHSRPESRGAPAPRASSSSASASSGAAAAAAAPAVSMPTALANALASLDPQVAAQLMGAVQQQLTGTAQPVAPAQPFNPYAAPNLYTSTRSTRAPTFQPDQSRQAAADAWERLLNLKAAQSHQVAPVPSSSVPFKGPAPALPYPPAATAQMQSWEQMVQAAEAQQLARSTDDAARLFSKRNTPAPAPSAPSNSSSTARYDPRISSAGALGRYVDQVLHSGIAEDRSRTHLRVEDEREALRRLLTFQPYASQQQAKQPLPPTDPAADTAGASPQLSRMVAEQKSLYLQDQAILNSVLRRVMTATQASQREEALRAQNALAFTAGGGGDAGVKGRVGGMVEDDGRALPATDVIRMIEEGYPHAAYDAWKHMSSNTLARSVLLAAEQPGQLFTRNVVEHTLHETLSELLSDAKVVELVKKATLKKLKHRLEFGQPLRHLGQQQHAPQEEKSTR
jgi:hypothetical protein